MFKSQMIEMNIAKLPTQRSSERPNDEECLIMDPRGSHHL